jgi:3-dehydroquinate synthase
MPTTLTVQQGNGYTLHFGHQLTNQLVQVAPTGPKALLFDLQLAPMAAQLAEGLGGIPSLGLTGGEQAKTLATYGQVLSWLAQCALPRNTTLYVLGGGTLTDLGGFVAASYLRGIQLISLPTTTLAMVDASVGGKTGLNLPEGKNLAGAFYLPQAVYMDLDVLHGLPQALFREGLVEAFKHGLISGQTELLRLEDLEPGLPRLEGYLTQAVQVKIGIVEADPFEKGERRKLNLGHTLGHALEAFTQHRLSHGQAIALGLLYAALLGRRLGGQDLVPQALRLLTWLGQPDLPSLNWTDLLPYLARDKKAVDSTLNWVIPLAPGHLEVGSVGAGILEGAFAEWHDLLTG